MTVKLKYIVNKEIKINLGRILKVFDFSVVASQSVSLNFTYGDENDIYKNTYLIEQLPNIDFVKGGPNSQKLELKALKVGHLVIGAMSNDLDM